MRPVSLSVCWLDRPLVEAAAHNRNTRKLAAAAGWLCDARVLLSGGAVWLTLARAKSKERRDAARFLLTISATIALHHGMKRWIDQTRPDRVMGGVKSLTGRASDAMPSRHAMHAGALAGYFARSTRWPAALWFTTVGLAATRVAALAHWPSGVAAGFIGGLAVERGITLIWPDRMSSRRHRAR